MQAVWKVKDKSLLRESHTCSREGKQVVQERDRDKVRDRETNTDRDTQRVTELDR